MSLNPSPSRTRLATLRIAVETLLEQENVTFTELSVGAICAEAGISRPTFYASFDDKQDLVRALAAQTIEELVGVSMDWLDAPKQSRGELKKAMRALFEAYGPHWRVMNAAAEVASYDLELRDRFTGAVEEAAARVAEHIAQGQRECLVRSGLDAAATARWLGWMTEGGMRRAFANPEGRLEREIAAMTDVHWFTLYDGVG
jgi:AcrR family transcriptional regulator